MQEIRAAVIIPETVFRIFKIFRDTCRKVLNGLLSNTAHLQAQYISLNILSRNYIIYHSRTYCFLCLSEFEISCVFFLFTVDQKSKPPRHLGAVGTYVLV